MTDVSKISEMERFLTDLGADIVLTYDGRVRELVGGKVRASCNSRVRMRMREPSIDLGSWLALGLRGRTSGKRHSE